MWFMMGFFALIRPRAGLRIVVPICLVLVAFASPLAFGGAGTGTWRAVNFPGVGGAIRSVWADIVDPDVCWAGLDMGVLFKTTDGGRTWKAMGREPHAINPGCAGYEFGRGLKGDPRDPNKVWSISGEIYRTLDGGATWSLVDRDMSHFKNRMVWDIAIDPDEPCRVYVIDDARWTKDCCVRRSCDDGATWRIAVPVPGTPLKTHDIEVVPGAGGKVLLATDRGLYISSDHGATWRRVAGLAYDGRVNYLRVAPWGDVYAMVPGGMFVSSDGGETWVRPEDAATQAVFDAVPKDQGRATMRWNVAPAKDGRLYLMANHHFTVFRSDPSRTKWERIFNPRHGWDALPTPPELAGYTQTKLGRSNNWHHYRADETNNTTVVCPWGPGTMDLVVSPADPSRLWIGSHAGLYRGDDSGRSIHEVGAELAGRLPFDRWAGLGVDTGLTDANYAIRHQDSFHLLVPNDIAFDPFDNREIAFAHYDVGIRVSHDAGVTSESGYDPRVMTARDSTQGYDVAYDPHHEGRLYATVTDVFRSDDRGRHWRRLHVKPAWEAMDRLWRSGKELGKDLAVWQFELDPFDPDGRRMIVAVRADTGRLGRAGEFPDMVCLSQDGGANWQVADGLPSPLRPNSLKYDPVVPGRVWLGTCGGRDAGLYRSDDGGATWRRIAARQIGGIGRDAISVVRGMICVCAEPAGAAPAFWGDRTIWMSNDEGTTWKPILTDFVTSVAVDPNVPGRVWVARPQGFNPNPDRPFGLYLTDDEGCSWRHVGPAFPACRSRLRIRFDSVCPKRMIALTPFGTWLYRTDGETLTKNSKKENLK